ncbi:MAG TPA: diguanylate cyclase, partial [Nitrospirae bacterium]|nr:diguanylate cyclase [Nitrospirota bacterium]
MNEKQRILIVDDVTLNIQLLNDVLKDEYEIFFSTNALDTIVMAEKNKPDIVLMDIMMPDINGYELCKQFKENPLFRDIPVIFITALDEIEHESKGLKLGAVDYITKPFNPEIVKLRVSNQLELKRNRDILSNLSRIDGLTGIPNRRAFDEIFAKEWLRAIREGTSISILMIDVDYFKLYNDYYGHSAGDECLKKVAQTIKLTLLRPADFVARYGGEEFVCLLPDTDETGALHTAKKILKAIIDLKLPHPTSLVSNHVSVSIGISNVMASIHSDPSIVLLEADKALYKAKDRGRNNVVLYNIEESKSEE